MNIFELMEEENINEIDVWDETEIEHIEAILPAEISTEVPGMERAIVTGNPIELGNELDFQQGYDNEYGAFGTCGLNAIANICHIGGRDITEPEVVEYAMENDHCIKDDPRFHGGGTSARNQLDLLSHFGFESHFETKDVADPERLAEAIEGGHGVLLALNSGILQDREWKIHNDEGEIPANHAVCLTGTVRDADTGELVGFYLCDSSSQSPDGGRTYVPLEKFNRCYSEVDPAYAIITNEAIR